VANMIEPAMLINIAQEYKPDLTSKQLYERTRRYWVCSPENRALKPKLAVSVAGGIIHEVYRIDSWESYPAGEEIYPDADRVKNEAFVPRKTRVGFFGAVSPAHARYKGLSVAHLQRLGAQNPIMYLNLDRVGRPAKLKGADAFLNTAQRVRTRGSRVLYFADYKLLQDRYKVAEIEHAADRVVWCCDEAPGFAPSRPQLTRSRPDGARLSPHFPPS
jgi:hypothetical protein